MIGQDVSYAVRSIVRRPGFALLVILTLGLGIGVNSAMFTVVNAVLLQPLPYPRSSELVFMYGSFARNDRAAISPPDFLDYRAANTVFSSLAAQRIPSTATISGDGDAEQVPATFVTANYFSTLGVAPLLGRTFRPDEEEGGGHDVVIISNALWQRRFGGVPDVVGKRLSVGGRPSEIVGVMPEVLDRTLGMQLWRPLEFHTPGMDQRRFHFLRAIGRLKPGVTIAQAQASMDVVAERLQATYAENKTWRLNMLPYLAVVVGTASTPLLVLLGAVAIVLLIACGNVAGLLLARMSARRSEMAVRAALGASRTRLVRQLLTESIVLALMAGIAGVALATGLVSALRNVGQGIVPRLAEVGLDPLVLAFTFALSLATGVAFGIAPALQVARENLSAAMAAVGRSSASRTTARARDVLVVAQVALSLVLLVGAGLLLRSLWRLQHVPAGFDATNVLTASISLPQSRYPEREGRLQFWENLQTRLRGLPGASHVSVTTMLPLRGGGDTRYWPEGRPPANESEARFAQINAVGDDYFTTMRIPIVAGRAFGGEDRAGPNTIILSRSLATRVFGGENPIGKRLVVDFGEPFAGEVVGIVGEVNAFGLDAPPPDVMYFSIHQAGGYDRTFMNVVIRTATDASALGGAFRSVLRDMDRELPLGGLTTMEEIIRRSTSRERFSAQLFAGLAIAALALAAVGLYGVLSYIVAQRTRELGIRIALGATRPAILRMVVARAMLIVGAGLVVGVAAAFATTRFVDRLLFQTDRFDPLVLISVPVVLLGVGLAAAIVPARRATRVDPLTALRAL